MDSKLKKRILKGSAATSIGTISSMVFQFMTIMIMTRYVPKEDFGIYVLVIVIVNMFNLLGGLGVELTMVKFIASDGQERRDVLMPVLILRAIGSLVFSFIFILTYKFVLHYFDERLSLYIWYILIIFILANYRDLFYNLMQALNQFRQYSIVNVASSAFRVLVVVIFIYIDKLDIESLLIIEILSTLQPLVHQIIVIPFKKHLSVKATTDTYKRVIKFSLPLYLNNVVTFINGRMNIFIIGLYLYPSSVANYDVASKVPQALKKIFSSFIIVYFPNLAKLFSQGDKKTAAILIERSIGIFSLVVSFLTLFAILFRNELTIFLFSERYAEVSLAFALLILNFLIRGFGDLMGYTLVPAGYPSVSPRVNTIASFISISLSFLLIPIYGFMGAVYSLLIMNLVSSLLFYRYLIKYNINFHLMIFLKPTVILLAAPLTLLFSGKFSVLLNIFLFIICIIIGWFLNEDMKNALNFVKDRIQNFKSKKIE
jgi:O-antigen/teichoic acid export membrane protein